VALCNNILKYIFCFTGNRWKSLATLGRNEYLEITKRENGPSNQVISHNQRLEKLLLLIIVTLS